MKENRTKEISFKELKNIMPSTKVYKSVPGVVELQKMHVEKYASYEMYEAEVNVYLNGFVSYKSHGHTTVFGIDRWNHIEYKSVYEEGSDPIFKDVTVDLKEIEDREYTLAIFVIGEERIQNNIDCKNEYYEEFYLDNDGNDWCEGSHVPDFVEELECFEERIKRENLEAENINLLLKGSAKLTERQKEVLKLLLENDLNHTKVSKILGTSQANISDIKSAAIKKLQKVLKNK